MIFSGMFFLPYVAVISTQMRRIPDIPWVLPALQLAAGAANVFTFVIPGMVMAVAAYRKDRDPYLVELMNMNMEDKVVYLTMTYDYIEGPLPKGWTNIKTIWLECPARITPDGQSLLIEPAAALAQRSA